MSAKKCVACLFGLLPVFTFLGWDAIGRRELKVGSSGWLEYMSVSRHIIPIIVVSYES